MSLKLDAAVYACLCLLVVGGWPVSISAEVVSEPVVQEVIQEDEEGLQRFDPEGDNLETEALLETESDAKDDSSSIENSHQTDLGTDHTVNELYAEAANESAEEISGETQSSELELALQGEFVDDSSSPGDEPSRWEFNAEYRVRSLEVNPIEINGEDVRDISWTEQRLRMDAGWLSPSIGGIFMQFDALNGVLFGDNGSFFGSPSSNAGVSLSSKRPNLTRWDIGLRSGADPLDRESYIPQLVEADLLQLNYLYADIYLPVGLLRVGRQPMNYGATITAHDGGRHNRWGVSQYSDAVDRILFGTKLDEVYKRIVGSDEPHDFSLDNGVIWAVFYDMMKQNNVALTSDNLRQLGTGVQIRFRESDWFGLEWRNFNFSGTAVYVFNEEFGSRLIGSPWLLETSVEDFHLKFQYMHIRGETSEIAEGFSALAGTTPQPQKLRMHGAQAVVDWLFGRTMWTMEFNYASGDHDPRVTAPITTYSFARDMNVGLLLFEHIMAFESARSVAVGVENLSGVETKSFPLTEVRTDGRFTNAIAMFPQLTIDWLRLPAHKIHSRMGVLMAWSASRLGVVDPVATALNDSGGRIEDAALNFHGGLPGRYYGTEFDLQLGYQFKENFFWTLEGAMLLPGAALRDEHGHAVRSFLLENRFEFLF